MTHENNQITFFASTNFRNKNQRFGIKKADRRHHMYIVGKTGMGKTTLMEHMIVSDLQQNNGFAVFDPHGDLAMRVLKHIPKRRKNDLVFFDPAEERYALPINLLQTSSPDEKHLVCSGLISVFKKLFTEFWGPRSEHILRNCILTLLEHPGATILDIPVLLTDQLFRSRLVSRVQDSVLRSFWRDEFEKYQSRFQQEAISPILNKIGQFAANPIVREIVGRPKDAIKVHRIMEQGKIFVANLAKGKIGEDAAALLGASLLTKFQLAALNRVSIPENRRKDLYLYIDEFHEFATESFAGLLPEARKFRLNLILSNQYLDQLSEEVRKAVLGSVGTIIVFRTGAEDAKVLSEEFFPSFKREDFVRLPKFHMYLRLMINGVVPEGFSAALTPFH